MDSNDKSSVNTPTVDETVDDQGPKKSRSPAPKAKRGAPTGSANAIRHGLTTGALPAGCAWIASTTNRFRATLEAAVLDAKGQVSLVDAAAINTATRWERHAMLALRWLRKAEDLTPDQRLLLVIDDSPTNHYGPKV